MNVRVFSMLAALLLLPLGACSSPSPQAQTEDRERALMTPLKTTYPDVIMGFDFHGSNVDISVDANALVSMDEDAEGVLKADSLKRWKATWAATHPKAHGTLRVRILDFRGTSYYDASAKV